MGLIEATAPQALGRRAAAHLSVAYVYRNFSRSGSIASLYTRTVERLSRDVEITAICSTGRRAQTDAPVRFVDIDPFVTGSGRFRYALECLTFARRATRAVLREPTRYDVVHAEGFASLWADVVTAHAVRRAEVDHYFEHVEPGADLRRRLSPTLFRPQVKVVVDIEKQLFRSPAPLVICPSQRVKDDLRRWHGVPGELVEVIPYGIDIAAFRHDPGARAGSARARASPTTPRSSSRSETSSSARASLG
jgi:glycosyltransferase involved in cell wall biosynthesis